MSRCRHCGETNENSATVCKNCGRDLVIKCPVCGRVFKWEIPVCPVCLWDFTSDGTSYPFAGEMDLAAVRGKIETARRKYQSGKAQNTNTKDPASQPPKYKSGAAPSSNTPRESANGSKTTPKTPKSPANRNTGKSTNTKDPASQTPKYKSGATASSGTPKGSAKGSQTTPKTGAASSRNTNTGAGSRSVYSELNTEKRPRRAVSGKVQPKSPSRIFTVILWVITVYISFELMGMMAYGGSWSVSKVKSGGINLAAWSLFALLLALFLGKRARRVMQNILIFAVLAVSAAVLIKGYSSDAGFIGRNIYTNAVQQMLSYRNEPLAMEDEETAEFIKSLTGKDEIRAYDVLFIHTVKTEGKNFVLGYSTKYFSNIVDLDISGAQQFRFNTAYMTNIRKLTLDNTKWGDENLKSIETYTLPNLVYFSAKNCGISDISPLKNAENLEHLNLSGNSITDVSPLSGLKKLRWLSVSETNVEDMSPLDNLKLDILFR